uniref:Uncharacterized protein n=1 Tax=Globisporangium ultimum (strain ATCC 200006 / CBS 805.95 / DAOM BR144) TaxID=431595 RepID=K3WGM3_GLOUD
MQEKEHARNLVSQEQYDNFSDDSAMKTSTTERQPIIASKDCEFKTEDTCCDRIAEQMFDDLYNSVVDSEVQISRKQHMPRQVEPQRSHSIGSDVSSSETNTPSTPEAAKIYRAEMATTKKKTESEISTERKLVSKIIEALDIQAGKNSIITWTSLS